MESADYFGFCRLFPKSLIASAWYRGGGFKGCECLVPGWWVQGIASAWYQGSGARKKCFENFGAKPMRRQQSSSSRSGVEA